ncbi:MAG: DUF1848 domain-containing protein [Desulfamplus sp.]|nr:DUF1848 domain-containing protein [Desulfamplus sp.]
MIDWHKINITNELEEIVEAQAPLIISASRSTDIPAFYSDWLMERLKEGFVKWINPFNGVPLYVSFAKTRLFVFWSKNPKPMLVHLDTLDERGLHYYFQFTLNDYDAECYEPAVPCLEERIETFILLSERLGKDRVIWRFDPLLLTDKLSVEDLLKKMEHIGDQLATHTSRLVFSFADIEVYAKVGRNLSKAGIAVREFSIEEMEVFAQELSALNDRWGLSLGTCAEKIDLAAYGIEHNRCIDDRLIIKCFGQDTSLMRFLGHETADQLDLFGSLSSIKKNKSLKDKGQREACGCIKSKDIGEYNTCPHICVYCYANTIPKRALTNYKRHCENPYSPSINE